MHQKVRFDYENSFGQIIEGPHFDFPENVDFIDQLYDCGFRGDINA